MTLEKKWFIVSKSGEIVGSFNHKISAVERKPFWENILKEKCYVVRKDKLEVEK